MNYFVMLSIVLLLGVAKSRGQDPVQSFELQRQPSPQSAYSKAAIALFAGDVVIRIEDARATRSILNDPCKCYEEKILPKSIAGTTVGMYTFSIGVAVILGGASHLLYRSGHHRLAYLVPAVDIATTSAVQLTLNR